MLQKISHAYVCFCHSRAVKIVPVECVDNFYPKNDTDFTKDKIYKVCVESPIRKNQIHLNAYVLLLGNSEEDVENRRAMKRVKFPNTRNTSFSNAEPADPGLSRGRKRKAKEATNEDENEATNEHENEATNEDENEATNEYENEQANEEINEVEPSISKPKKKPRTQEPKDTATRQTDEGILMRYKKLTAAASDIDDFPPSEAEINDYEANEELADDPSPIHRSQSADTIIITEGLPHKEPVPVLEPTPEHHTPRQVIRDDAGPSSIEFYIPQRSSSPESGQNAEEEGGRSSQAVSQKRTTRTRNSAPSGQRSVLPQGISDRESPEPQVQASGHRENHGRQRTPERQNPRRYAEYIQRRADVPCEMVYITEDRSIDRDTWEYLLTKPDPKFVKDMAVLLWGTEVLAQRCINPGLANKGKEPHESRPELTPEKYDRLKDCFFHKLTKRGVVGGNRKARMKLVGRYVSTKIFDIRKKLKLT